jgi:hypothetical protein
MVAVEQHMVVVLFEGALNPAVASYDLADLQSFD